MLVLLVMSHSLRRGGPRGVGLRSRSGRRLGATRYDLRMTRFGGQVDAQSPDRAYRRAYE
jgi:hypothetical protein